MAVTTSQCMHGIWSPLRCLFCSPPGVWDAAELAQASALPPVQHGWSCPTCGHSYAPWVPMCHFCPAPEQPDFIGKAADDG